MQAPTLSDAEVYEIQVAIAKSQGISIETYQSLLAERRGMIDRSRLAGIGVVV